VEKRKQEFRLAKEERPCSSSSINRKGRSNGRREKGSPQSHEKTKTTTKGKERSTNLIARRNVSCKHLLWKKKKAELTSPGVGGKR